MKTAAHTHTYALGVGAGSKFILGSYRFLLLLTPVHPACTLLTSFLPSFLPDFLPSHLFRLVLALSPIPCTAQQGNAQTAHRPLHTLVAHKLLSLSNKTAITSVLYSPCLN